jgi:hypothetical protein
LQQFADAEHVGPVAIVDIVVIVGDLVGQIAGLRFQGLLFMQIEAGQIAVGRAIVLTIPSRVS